jgi:hypothetical protein
MARRSTTSLIIVTYIAGQLAMVPHSHGAVGISQSSDHNASPHIHVSWFDRVDHSHDDGHSHHHEHGSHHSHRTTSDADTVPVDHDSDAVYLPNEIGVSLSSKPVVSPDCLSFIATIVIDAAHTPMAQSESGLVALSLGECSPNFPIYLALRALRI